MRKFLMLLALSLVFLAPARPADAKLLFGTQETIHFLQDVEVTGPKQEKLFLGYMTRIENFGGGLYVQDVGYVLGVKGDAGRYFHMPEGEELARFQRDGYLPNPWRKRRKGAASPAQAAPPDGLPKAV